MTKNGETESEIYSTDRKSLKRECIVEFIRDSGPGGQHRNKRETGVRLFHPPSGITVTAVERRSQARNLEQAFERMAKRLDKLNEVSKERISTRPSRSSIKNRLEDKRRQSEKKAARRPPSEEE